MDEQNLIHLTLTPQQAKKLSDVLWKHVDEGPEGEGWPSAELEELRELVDDALEEQS